MTNEDLDLWIAENVMGFYRHPTASGWLINPTNSRILFQWQPTRDIAQAMEVEERVASGKCDVSPALYIEKLGEILKAECFGGFSHTWSIGWMRHLAFAHATPRQRTLAAARAFGWEGE